MSIWDAALWSAFLVFTTGAFLVGFARLLGVNDFWLGVMMALPALVGILQIVGSVWGDAFESRRQYCIPLALAIRFSWVGIALLPLLPAVFPRAALLLLLLAAAGAAASLTNPPFLGWLGDLVPEEYRGRFFGRRAAVAGVVTLCVALPAGFLVDHIMAAYSQKTGYAVAYWLAVVAVFLSFYFFSRIPEPPRPSGAKRTSKDAAASLRYALTDPDFRWVLIPFATFSFAALIPSAFFADYMLGPLHLKFAVIQVYTMLATASSIATTGFWGYLVDKFGGKPVLIISVAGAAPVTALWGFVTPDNMVVGHALLATAQIFGGAFWCGIGISQIKLMIGFAPDQHRTVAMGAITSLTAIAGGIAPMLGGALMELLKGFIVGPARYETLFLIGALARALTVPLMFRLPDPKSRTLREMVSQLTGMTPKGMIALRALVTKADAGSRAAAAEKLGESRMQMAVEALGQALRDPQPTVRRKALAALSQIGGAEATSLIVQSLREHPEDADEEAVEMLGRVHTQAAAEVVAPLLASPSPGLRTTAARTLGGIGGEVAVRALVEAARPGTEPELRRAAIRALGQTGDPAGFDLLIDALDAPSPGVRMAAAEAVGRLGIRDAAPLLRQMLPQEEGAVAAEMAYALGSVGEAEDLDALLDVVRRVSEGLPLQRSALGVARLLDVESHAYRLMLLQGMERDTAVLQVLRSRRHRSGDWRRASQRYSEGDEIGALESLAAAPDADPRLRRLLEVKSPEALLVAVALVAAEPRFGTRTAKRSADHKTE
jgi:HEAT repeat protein